jgi:hypothetical protein
MDAFACIESRPNSNLQPDVDTFACIESRPNSNLQSDADALDDLSELLRWHSCMCREIASGDELLSYIRLVGCLCAKKMIPFVIWLASLNVVHI